MASTPGLQGAGQDICKPGGLRWHSRMPTECPIWKINSVSHLNRASLTLVFTDGVRVPWVCAGGHCGLMGGFEVAEMLPFF